MGFLISRARLSRAWVGLRAALGVPLPWSQGVVLPLSKPELQVVSAISPLPFYEYPLKSGPGEYELIQSPPFEVERGGVVARILAFDLPLLSPCAGEVSLEAGRIRITRKGGHDDPRLIASSENGATESELLGEGILGAPLGEGSSKSAFLERARQAGVAGLGGGLFPSHLKLSGEAGTLILNAVECEPFYASDSAILRTDSLYARVIRALETCARLLSAPRVVVAVEAGRESLSAHLRSKLPRGVELFEVAHRYPAGSELSLCEEIAGLRLERGQHASEFGVVILNVGTMLALFEAWFLGAPLWSRVVTLVRPGGAVALRAPLGGSLVALWSRAFGKVPSRFVAGGVMMGGRLASSRSCLTLADGGLLALDESPRAPSRCIRCNACVAVCPAGLLPQELFRVQGAISEGGGSQALRERLSSLRVEACLLCGACEYACPSRLPLVESFSESQALLREAREAEAKKAHARARFEAKALRQAERGRLRRGEADLR